MKAVTFWRPWPWAFIVAGKPVENRSWQLPETMLGERLAIHAGKTFDEEAADWIEVTFGLTVPPEHEHPTGIVATGVYRGSAAAHGLENSPWYVGPVGWVLGDVKSLDEPLACRGAQKLWTVPMALTQALT